MVFGDRLPARSDKGRVFLLGAIPPPPPPAPEIGAVEITPSSRSLSAGTTAQFTASVTGGTATNFLFNWTVRSGEADLISANNTSATVEYEFNTSGSTQIQCYVASPGADNTPQSSVSTVIVS